MRCGPARLRLSKMPAGRRNLAGLVSLWRRERRDCWKPGPSRVPPQKVPGGTRSSEGYSNSFRELAGDAFVNFSGKTRPFVFGDPIEVEHVLLAPIAHHFEARKDIHVIDITNPVKRVQILLEINDGRRAMGELQVDEHDVDTV